ncbi:hypothetical protein [Amycolatopsis japonica]|uniref:hypothetical protein n=1 Tax=Amycolatopsis japonica TaxID=208439 RepID=UPI0011DDF8F9|nr:hypothetical protein [Amycolatopsis japonica]
MDFSTLTGPVATVVAALAGLVAARRRENRLRSSIQANLSSIEKLRELKLDSEKLLVGKFEAALSIQIDSLLGMEEAHARGKQRNWPSLAAAFLLAAIVSTPMWLMWRPQVWYAWTLFVALGAFSIMLIMSGLMAWRKGPDEGKAVRSRKG